MCGKISNTAKVEVYGKNVESGIKIFIIISAYTEIYETRRIRL